MRPRPPVGQARKRRIWRTHELVAVAARGYGQNGFRMTGIRSAEWNISADCQSPARLELDGRTAFRKGNLYRDDRGPTLSLVINARCRKCQRCLEHRRRLWAARAAHETIFAQRSWFGTITLNPHHRMMMQYRAMQRLDLGGTVWEHLTPAERLEEISIEIGRELTNWLKRVRKEIGARLRYILVQELHKDGTPHYHCILHEVPGSAPVLHRTLTRQWKLGFTKFALVTDKRSAYYVAKYLSKDSSGRVRASLRYGQPISYSEVKNPERDSETKYQRANTPHQTHNNQGYGDLHKDEYYDDTVKDNQQQTSEAYEPCREDEAMVQHQYASRGIRQSEGPDSKKIAARSFNQAWAKLERCKRVWNDVEWTDVQGSIQGQFRSDLTAKHKGRVSGDEEMGHSRVPPTRPPLPHENAPVAQGNRYVDFSLASGRTDRTD